MARYRKFVLGEDINLIVRCEHDAALATPNNETQYFNIKALNEFDPRVRRIRLLFTRQLIVSIFYFVLENIYL